MRKKNSFLITVWPLLFSSLQQIFKSKPYFEELCSHENEIEQIHPHDRWVEQDPLAILDAVHKCATEAVRKLDNFIPSIYSKNDIAAVGITNQRETVIVWDKHTGKPLHNAIGKQLFHLC